MDRGRACIPAGIAAGLALGVGVGCGSPSTEGGIDSPVPAARLAGIQQAARQGDTSALPSLVESLDSDDIAVRIAAITTLERLTGERFGYDADGASPARRASIARWAAYVEAQRPASEDGP